MSPQTPTPIDDFLREPWDHAKEVVYPKRLKSKGALVTEPDWDFLQRGVLKSEHAERNDDLVRAVFDAHGVDFGNWQEIALSLMEAHIPGFQMEKPRGTRSEPDRRMNLKKRLASDVNSILFQYRREHAGREDYPVLSAAEAIRRLLLDPKKAEFWKGRKQRQLENWYAEVNASPARLNAMKGELTGAVDAIVSDLNREKPIGSSPAGVREAVAHLMSLESAEHLWSGHTLDELLSWYEEGQLQAGARFLGYVSTLQDKVSTGSE